MGAKFVAFAGWEMPVQYSGSIEEHLWVRQSAAVFDISHMGRILLTGARVAEWLEIWTTIDAFSLEAGKCRYGFVLDASARIIDDVYVFRPQEEFWILVVNAANRQRVLERCSSIPGMSLRDMSELTAMLAIQGPKTGKIWKELGFKELPAKRNICWEEEGLILSRTGYTGELGIEVIASLVRILELWGKVLNLEEVKPAGLAARDSLRFEAGYYLYGNELNPEMRPADSGLKWVLRKARLENLAGWEALKRSKASKAIFWLKMEEKGLPRSGYTVMDKAAQPFAVLASGMYCPSLDGFFASAICEVEALPLPGTDIYVEIRESLKLARVVTAPVLAR